jgi:malonyl CoA-acyl carrier protein transacylase
VTDIRDLLSRAAEAASKTQPDSDLLAVVKHGDEARRHVWNKHYAAPAERLRLAEKLASASPDFQAAVAATENALAEEIADDNARRARVRANNPTYFKD